MLVQRDTLLIEVDSPHKDGISVGDTKIIIDTDYNRYDHSRQIGKIHTKSIQITKQYLNDVPLEIGDEVVFHHFVCQPDHKMPFGKNVYRCEYFHLYAKIVEGKIMPLEDVIFVDPILEPEENMFIGKVQIKPHREFLKQQGIVFAASNKAKSMGILPGDKVFFTPNADYSMNVTGKHLWRMRVRNIIAVERDGNLVAMSDKLLVKVLPEERKFGAVLTANHSTLKGEVVVVGKDLNGIEPGIVINYYNGLGGTITHNGRKYSYIELRNINYIYETCIG